MSALPSSWDFLRVLEYGKKRTGKASKRSVRSSLGCFRSLGVERRGGWWVSISVRMCYNQVLW